jgi:outer membrane protein TolC
MKQGIVFFYRHCKQITWLLLLLLLFSKQQFAQQPAVKILSEQDVVGIVKKFHPIVKQAVLDTRRAKAGVLEARGGFDPQLATNFERKRFDDLLYYSYLNPEIVIPTWYGIEINAGAEEIVGSRVSNELTLGKTSYAGIKLPLAKNLLLDERRAVLKQSQLFTQQALAQQQNTINDILFEAITAYWHWVNSYQDYKLVSQILSVNRERLRFVKIEFEQGNRPAIDTTEAITQLQTFELLQSQAYLDFLNNGLALSNYLWLENNEPLVWVETIIPADTLMMVNLASYQLPAVDSIVSIAFTTHPKLKVFENKINILEIERRLKTQYLLPKFDVKANILSKGYNAFDKYSSIYLQHHYKLGFNFQVPLFLRSARGALQQTKFKLQQVNYDQQYVMLQIENKIKSYYNEVIILQKQLMIAEQSLNNYDKLYKGELTKFNAGESTLFILNTREYKLIEARQKLVEVKAKLNKGMAAVMWASGQFR